MRRTHLLRGSTVVIICVMRPQGAERSKTCILHCLACWQASLVQEYKTDSYKYLICLIRRVISPPIICNILTESTPEHCPCTRTATLLPMNLERVILLIPVAQLLATQKAGDAVSVLPAWCPVEACLGQGLWVGIERGRMRPFNGSGSGV